MTRDNIFTVQYCGEQVGLARVYHSHQSQSRLRQLLLTGEDALCARWVPSPVPEYVQQSTTFNAKSSFALEFSAVLKSIAYSYMTLLENPSWAAQEVRLQSPVTSCNCSHMLVKMHYDAGTSTRRDNITKNDVHCANILGAECEPMLGRCQFLSRVSESHQDALANMGYISEWLQVNQTKPEVIVVYPGAYTADNVGSAFNQAGVNGDIVPKNVSVAAVLNGDLRGLAYLFRALQPGSRMCCIFGPFNDENMGLPWVTIFVNKQNRADEGRKQFLKVMREEVRPFAVHRTRRQTNGIKESMHACMCVHVGAAVCSFPRTVWCEVWKR